MHSNNFIKFRSYYINKLWTKEMLRNTVGRANGITADEYQEITGEAYTAE